MTRPKIAVCGWIGSSNLGDDLIADQVAELIREAGAEPTLVTIADEPSANGVPTIRHAGALDTIGLALALRHHDGLVFGGGGLIQDETGPLNLPFHLTRLAAGRGLRLPWACIGLGVGDVRRRSGRLLTRLVARGFVAGSVRDTDSAERYHELTGLRPEVGVDPVLALPPQDVAPTDHLVISLRPINRPDQRRLATGAPPDDEQIERWADAIDQVATATGLSVRFTCFDDTHDQAIHEAVAARITAPHVLERPTTSNVIERVGSSRLVISMRYHGAVSAIVAGRPTLVLDYSPKMAALVDEIGPGLRRVAPDAPAAELVAGALSVLEDPPPSGLPDVGGRAEVNRSVIRRLVEAASER